MPSIKKHTKRPWLPERKPYEGYRHNNTDFYQSRRWRSLRALKLQKDPLCEECMRKGVLVPAQMVDHIVPINKGGAPLDLNNLQSLCNHCHAVKTARDK
jgi:5-methylcytosine-specific restriction protein A